MGARKQDRDAANEPRWEDVRIFLATYRHKSLGAAASRLGLDTSTVSRRLAVLEASLGVRLFERTREGLLSTHGAERVLPAAEAMEAAHGRLTRDASDIEAKPEGLVRVSVAPGMADAFVAPTLVRLRAKYPKIEIELEASERPLDLSRHEADMALRSTRPHGEELVVTKIGTGSWVAVAAPALVKRLGRLTSWNDAPWITWDRDFGSFPPTRWLAQHAPKASLALRTSHFASQLVAAESGLGAVLVPPMYLATHKVKPVLYEETLAPSVAALPVDSLWLVGHRALRDVPRVAAVWTFLADEMRRVVRDV